MKTLFAFFTKKNTVHLARCARLRKAIRRFPANSRTRTSDENYLCFHVYPLNKKTGKCLYSFRRLGNRNRQKIVDIAVCLLCHSRAGGNLGPVPAKAGNQIHMNLDSCFRRNDDKKQLPRRGHFFREKSRKRRSSFRTRVPICATAQS